MDAYVHLIRICLYLLYFAFPALLAASEAFEHLKLYEGRWVGEFTIKSDVSDYSESFTVEQQYWIDGDKLYGVSVYERPKTGMESAESVVTINSDSSLLMQVRRGDEVEVFVGVYRDDTIVWLPRDLQRAEDYQTTVCIKQVDGLLKMTTEGFDTYVHSGGIGHIIFLGKLDFISK